jgi:hypothetical protein
MPNMNKIRPNVNALVRHIFLHTYRQTDGIPEATLSYSEGPKTNKPVKTQRSIFVTITILFRATCMRK